MMFFGFAVFSYAQKFRVLEADVLPRGWERRYSAEDKKYYYENEELGRTVWDADEIDAAV